MFGAYLCLTESIPISFEKVTVCVLFQWRIRCQTAWIVLCWNIETLSNTRRQTHRLSEHSMFLWRFGAFIIYKYKRHHARVVINQRRALASIGKRSSSRFVANLWSISKYWSDSWILWAILSARITHFKGGILGGIASYVHFAEFWGLVNQKERFGAPSLDREKISFTGMMKPNVVDVMGLAENDQKKE